MREKLESMSQLAQTNLTHSQTRQQTWYDKKERARIIQSGDKALVMLQSDNSKLLTKW